jgi:hypothetical protein
LESSKYTYVVNDLLSLTFVQPAKLGDENIRVNTSVEMVSSVSILRQWQKYGRFIVGGIVL